MSDRYIFPAVFTMDNQIIYVRFPDIEYCITDGKNQEEAFLNANEALELCLYDIECEGKKIPKPSDISEIKLEANEVIVLINIWMPLIREKVKDVYVKKTLTIPRWLDELGKEQKINFSKVLQEALKSKLGIN